MAILISILMLGYLLVPALPSWESNVLICCGPKHSLLPKVPILRLSSLLVTIVALVNLVIQAMDPTCQARPGLVLPIQ